MGQVGEEIALARGERLGGLQSLLAGWGKQHIESGKVHHFNSNSLFRKKSVFYARYQLIAWLYKPPRSQLPGADSPGLAFFSERGFLAELQVNTSRDMPTMCLK